MRRARPASRREPTIALINIVFLMLVFFMVAGTLTQPLDRDLRLVDTAELDGRAPVDGLVLHADGRMSHGGAALASATDYLAALESDAPGTVRVIPDRALPAGVLVAVARELRAGGAERVLIVTERALP